MTRPLVSRICKLQEFDNLALRPGASLKECECRGLDVVLLLIIADAAPRVSRRVIGAHFRSLRSHLCPPGLTMIGSDGVLESGDQSSIRPEPPKKMHLPGKATPTGGSCGAFTDGSPKVTANGVHDIEDRILRITGYYGYNPGYSSHRSE